MNRKYDVVVAGAGVAGVAAAVAASRQGAHVALVEKQFILGGLATSGLIYIYLPLCDGYGHLVSSGIALEMLRECTDYGPFELPEEWRSAEPGATVKCDKRCKTPFAPGGFILVLDRMLRQANVDLWLDTRAAEVEMDGARVAAVRVVNDSGSSVLEADCFVDATGGGSLVRLAGGGLREGENFLDPWFLEIAEDSSLFGIHGALHIRRIGGGAFGTRRVSGVVGGEAATNFMRDSWQMLRDYYDAMPAETRRRNFPVQLAAMPQFRKIARIDARFVLSDADVGRHFADSVGVVGDWRRAAPVWETPYRALLPDTVRGVVAAGRCIGADGDAWEVFRVIPAAAVTGEAAGTAAALAAERSLDPADLPAAELRKRLATAGVLTDAAPEWGVSKEN